MVKEGSVVPGALICAKAECGVRDIRPIRRDVSRRSQKLDQSKSGGPCCTTAVVKSRADEPLNF